MLPCFTARRCNFVFAALLVFLFSCRIQPVSYSALNTNTEPAKIIFLTFSIKHNKIKKESACQLISIQTVEGKAKIVRSDKDSTLYRNYLLCNYTDEKGNVEFSTVIEHPLYKTMEYVDENNKLGIKQLDLDSAQFSLRVNSIPGMTRLQISQVVHKSNPEKLINIRIQ
jgi:hypothetical protein